jgi:hypothetical protein
LTDQITPFYILKDTKGHLLRGKFLQHQLTPANISVYRGQPIKQQKHGKCMEYLFEFKGYSPEFNEWVSKEQLGRI